MSLLIVRAVGLVTVQDVGRPGHMHEGLAPGGAMVPELLAEANRQVRNSDDAAAVEVMGALTVRAERDIVVSAGAGTRTVRAGEELSVASGDRRVAYLAIRGGIDAPLVLGSRSTQLSAGLGARLRAGDRLLAGDSPVGRRSARRFVDRTSIRILPGPDLDAFTGAAIDQLTSRAWTISPNSNRVGTRLDGAPVDRASRPDVTRPLVRGAIEVPGDGLPIVLGPEHPTTGGYPVLGVIAHEDLGAFFAIPPGAPVRLRLVGGTGARLSLPRGAGDT